MLDLVLIFVLKNLTLIRILDGVITTDSLCDFISFKVNSSFFVSRQGSICSTRHVGFLKSIKLDILRFLFLDVEIRFDDVSLLNPCLVLLFNCLVELPNRSISVFYHI